MNQNLGFVSHSLGFVSPLPPVVSSKRHTQRTINKLRVIRTDHAMNEEESRQTELVNLDEEMTTGEASALKRVRCDSEHSTENHGATSITHHPETNNDLPKHHQEIDNDLPTHCTSETKDILSRRHLPRTDKKKKVSYKMSTRQGKRQSYDCDVMSIAPLAQEILANNQLVPVRTSKTGGELLQQNRFHLLVNDCESEGEMITVDPQFGLSPLEVEKRKRQKQVIIIILFVVSC